MDRSSKGTAFLQWFAESPAEWNRLRLRNVLDEILAGNWGEDAGISEADRYCARIADFDWQHLKLLGGSLRTIRSYTYASASRFVLRDGDLLVEKSGGGEKHPVGRCVQYEGNEGPAFTNFAMRLRTNQLVLSDYLKFVLAASYYRGHSWKILSQTTGIQNLDVSAFRSTPIPLPSVNEQKQIVTYLDAKTAEIDGLVSKLEREAELLERYRRQLIARTVTRGLHPNTPMRDSGVEWIGEVPKAWRVIPLKALLRRKSSKNRPDLRVLSVERNQGVVDREAEGSADNHNRLPEDLSGYLVVSKGQFVMNKMKAWQGSYGVSFYDGIVSPAYYVFDLSTEVPEFFNWMIRSDAFIPFFGMNSFGIRTDQWDFKVSALRTIPLFMPSKHEQRKIAVFLDRKTVAIDSAIAGIKRQIELLSKYRKQVINDTVTGKIRVGEVA
ncbi:restriction endonuclease subunit S [Gleimia sp. 6138-11-ORH1]|uniref:restriction endonuclease subunit S n=1 Tax=Gleimia sp. 6138-11-ORH1 TaxID=2973937 RepID=UPI002169D493|nr:restriction endonuclease subunit S [Gleimia sp. 6138-11-ORH1]MCS4484004.1 restriction endonuclease subunit S [Gleimia sp. 6138-11-ORH1]